MESGGDLGAGGEGKELEGVGVNKGEEAEHRLQEADFRKHRW